MIRFRKSLLHLLLPVVLTGCMSGPNFSSRWTGRSEKAWRDAFLAARMAEQKGDLMRASAAYEELLQKHPQKAEAYHRLGILCQKSGRAEEAIQHLSRAHQMSPMDIEVLCDLGYIHYLQNRPKDAVETLQKAQQINPGHERTQANLAVALIAMDQVPSAVALLRQNMGEAPAATMVGFALAQRGELNQAKKYFSQALDADAGNQPAAEALVQIEEMLNAQQNPSEQPAETSPRGGVVEAGQMAALPFEVISEGVVTRPTSGAESSRSVIAAVRDSSTVTPAAATSAMAGQVEQTAAATPVTAEKLNDGELPALKVPSSTLAAPTSKPLQTSETSGAEKKIESTLITVRNSSPADQPQLRSTSSDGSTLPPVQSTGSWRASRQKPSFKQSDSGEGLHFSNRQDSDGGRDVHVWRSASSRISKVGFSEPLVSSDDSLEFTDAELLPPVDGFESTGGEELADVAPFVNSSRYRRVVSPGHDSERRGTIVSPESGLHAARKAENERAGGRVRTLPTAFRQLETPPQQQPRTPAPVQLAAAAMPVSDAIVVPSPAAAAPVAVASPVVVAAPVAVTPPAVAPAPVAVAPSAVVAPPTGAAASPVAAAGPKAVAHRAAAGTVGGLPLAFLRAMYVQMNEEQKVIFWKDLRKLPGDVSEAELSAYRELARSTENLPRVEAAITLLAVFREDKLATELLSNLDKSPDPVVRQAASTADSMLQIRLGDQGAK